MHFLMDRRHWLVAALAVTGVGTWAASPKPQVEMWKDPSCGCCKDWVAHLEKSGLDVRIHETGNAAARARLGIPPRLGSCHTATVGGYALEGHVPARDIQRLLREKPKALGLVVPGMPVGSPGMDGPMYGGRTTSYEVLLLASDGKTRVYSRY